MNDIFLKELPYETRNLGIHSYTVISLPASASDAEELARQISSQASQVGAAFVQAKCEIGEVAQLHLLEEIGFRFVDTALIPTCRLDRNLTLSSFCSDPGSVLPKKFSPHDVSVVTMELNDHKQISRVGEIAGESFTRDRFHLDPNCSDAAADRRYINWVNDLLADENVTFHLLMYKDIIEGFMARRSDHLVLAGFSRRHTRSGFGDYLWLSVLMAMQSEGLAQVHTQISASNTPVLNLYARLGFKFREPFYMLHKWIGQTA